VGDPLRVRLCFANERLQPLLQVRRRDLVEAMIDLACVDEILAPASAEINAIPFALVQRKAGDRQGLSLRAGLLDPVVAATARVAELALPCGNLFTELSENDKGTSLGSR
jgi:hypothetical protein